MNKELKKGGSRKYFALFPSEIAADVTRKRNKKLLNMTLRQVITNSELYKSKSYNNFIHNINVLESLNDSKNNILENLLNSKYSELFAQYLKSDSFENDVNKLKQKEERERHEKEEQEKKLKILEEKERKEKEKREKKEK